MAIPKINNKSVDACEYNVRAQQEDDCEKYALRPVRSQPPHVRKRQSQDGDIEQNVGDCYDDLDQEHVDACPLQPRIPQFPERDALKEDRYDCAETPKDGQSSADVAADLDAFEWENADVKAE